MCDTCDAKDRQDGICLRLGREDVRPIVRGFVCCASDRALPSEACSTKPGCSRSLSSYSGDEVLPDGQVEREGDEERE